MKNPTNEPQGENENQKSNYSEGAIAGTDNHPEEKDTDIRETTSGEDTDELAGDIAGNASGNDDSEE